ncbi:phage integrase N-terminal SAM-like domain-containing protein [Motiliproteus sediminis]|uniref:phage integrase N-terminal SAM-like domain-containing protein n=1 Tax=Motiliproteus sediminis TaxID=1468178 RepID=UPI001AEF6D16|nr:phage integrase N-terminal SAM-like domain-containing protein [Motiliproteus sediminis]
MSSSPLLQSIGEHRAVRRYSPRTIKAYRYWIKIFIRFNGRRHPRELGRMR